jgi:two-component system sensor histidine kinase VicK
MIGRLCVVLFLLVFSVSNAQEITSGDATFDRLVVRMDSCTHVHDSVFIPCPAVAQALSQYMDATRPLRVWSHYYAAIGGYYNRLGIVDSSLYYLQRVVDLGPDIDDLNYFRTLVSLGATYYERGEFGPSIRLMLMAQEFERQVYWPFYNGLLNNYMGILFYSEGGYEQAAHHFLAALRSLMQTYLRPEKKYLIQNVLNNLGLSYMQLEMPQTAYTYFHQAYRVSIWDMNPIGESISLMNLARIQAQLGRHMLADSLFQVGICKAARTENLMLEARGILLYAEFLEQQDKLYEAGDWLKLLEERMDNIRDERAKVSFFQLFARVEAHKGHYQKAYAYEDRSRSLSEALHAKRGNKLIQLEEAQIELNRLKDAKEELLHFLRLREIQSNAILMGGSVLLVLVLVIFFLWINLRRRFIQTQELSKDLRQKSGQFARANQELELANKHKNYILSTVAHDLRNILGNVVQVSDIIAEGPSGALPEQEQRQLLKLLKTSAKLGLNTIQDLNDAIRPGNQENLDVVPLLPEALLAELRDLLHHKCRQKRIEFITKNQAPFLVAADREKITRVFINLIDNAIKYSKPGGKIKVLIRQKGASEVEFCVRDFGTGIPRRMQHKLFRPFTAGVKGTLGEPTTGLGLYIVKKIVTAHRGYIKVRTKEGKGTLFLIRLPFAR